MKVIGVSAAVTSFTNIAKRAKDPIIVAANTSLIMVEAEAKRLIRSGYYQPAIDTGKLRNSLTHRLDTGIRLSAVAGIVGTSVYYAIHVHYGTRVMTARPFLKDAVKNKSLEMTAMWITLIKKLHMLK